ncbi:MAG TPA: FAD-dependent oxidoreductase, partial [Candidatus Binataceae bacterium]|nr:FAD-dependent oxidoreductase [Candidatus Binataceae bacterium]
RVDFKKVIARSRAAADKLSRGVRFLLKKNNVDYVEAEARIAGPNRVTLATAYGKAPPPMAELEAERILIAAGSGEKLFQGMKAGDGVVTSREALVLDKLPASVAIIGAGAIGLEFGYFYNAFGAKVTIIELEKQMLPGFDAEVAEELRRSFVRRRVTVMLGHGYKSMARTDGQWNVTVESGGNEKSVTAEVVLIAVGRTPLSDGLGLDKAGIEVKPGGFIKINESFQTTVPSIYAIGDVVRAPLLAHKASAEGIAAVEIMAGARKPGFDLTMIPACIYCEPEVASVGLSEAEARERGIDVKIGKFPFRANGKAVAIGQTEGFVKLVAGIQYGEVIGCQIIGYHATDLISEVVLGKSMEATAAEFGKAAHPHPTMSEAIMEAALAAEGEAINF